MVYFKNIQKINKSCATGAFKKKSTKEKKIAERRYFLVFVFIFDKLKYAITGIIELGIIQKKMKVKSISNPKFKISTIATLILIPIAFFTFYKNYFESLIKINFESNIDIVVKKAFNEHGTLIINGQYWIESDTRLLNGVEKLKLKDPTIIHNFSKFVPVLSNVEPPYKILKVTRSNNLYLIKKKDTVLMILDTI